MLTITLIALVLAIPLSFTSSASGWTNSKDSNSSEYSVSQGTGNATISPTLYTRVVAIALVFAAAISYNAINTSGSQLETLDAGVGLYSGLIHATTMTQTMEVFLLVSGALVLLPWASSLQNSPTTSSSAYPTIPEYSMLILFTTMGATFLLASSDLVSMYLAIELQSFGVYILAAVYRDSESATAAGLKYFLLGALSSALILLGSALVYSYTGLTNLDSIYEFISVLGPDTQGDGLIVLGFIIISVGLLFKVASAPFHYWAPDVYDGTPTIVTTWLTVMPKISIFVFLLELYQGTSVLINQNISYISGISTNLLLVCAFLSLVIGTVVGLGQYRIKRLLAYSTISHVGFLLLALAISSATIIAGEESVEAFLFYIVQYSLTNINTFFVLLAFGYLINKASNDVQYTSELQGQFRANPVLGLSFAICLFSMAGVPPLMGFFAKYTVLYSAINNGYVFLAIVAILASVVSAVYYLRIIRVIHFSDLTSGQSHLNPNVESNLRFSGTDSIQQIGSVHSYIIASLTLIITLFAVNPTLILNSTSIMALSLYVT
jgi:NADH-ubiquinone oxidoreductase chain 2